MARQSKWVRRTTHIVSVFLRGDKLVFMDQGRDGQ